MTDVTYSPVDQMRYLFYHLHHVKYRTYQSQSGERPESRSATGMIPPTAVYSNLIRCRTVKVNTTGAMGLANVVRGNLGEWMEMSAPF